MPKLFTKTFYKYLNTVSKTNGGVFESAVTLSKSRKKNADKKGEAVW